LPEWFEGFTVFVNRVVVVLLLVAIIYIADTATRRAAKGSEYRLSARAGWWAGVLSFILYINVLSFVAKIDVPGKGYPYLLVVPLTLVLGYYLVSFIKKVIIKRYGGFAVMFMVFVGASTLFTLLVVPNQDLKKIISWATYGLAFGILIRAILHPKTIEDFYPEPDYSIYFPTGRPKSSPQTPESQKNSVEEPSKEEASQTPESQKTPEKPEESSKTEESS